jgi:hypothetical protein
LTVLLIAAASERRIEGLARARPVRRAHACVLGLLLYLLDSAERGEGGAARILPRHS